MDITPPRASEGTEALRRNNEQRGITPTGAIAPAQALQASSHGREQPEKQPQGPVPERNSWPFVERRSGVDRRAGADRRRRDDPAWLDTRSNQERRTNLRRAEDRRQAAERAGEIPPTQGINAEA